MAERRRAGRQPQGDAPALIIPEGVSEYYVNSSTVAATPVDFMLFFGSTILPSQITAGNTHITSGTRVDAVIRMSPQHTKAVLRALADAIQGWERDNGEIRIPEEGGPDAPISSSD